MGYILNLPIYKPNDILPSSKDFLLMQNRWKAIIDPVLSLPTNQGVILKNVVLTVGDNVINHLLGRMMQGWILIDIDGAAMIYRSADFNSKTLTLNTSADVIINLEVF